MALHLYRKHLILQQKLLVRSAFPLQCRRYYAYGSQPEAVRTPSPLPPPQPHHLESVADPRTVSSISIRDL